MRIAVKNLPESTKESEIRNTFSKIGNLTDIFMLKTANRKFRRICFIGYSKEEEANSAVSYFNNSIFKNHKIKVEKAIINKDNSKENDIILNHSSNQLSTHLSNQLSSNHLSNQLSNQSSNQSFLSSNCRKILYSKKIFIKGLISDQNLDSIIKDSFKNMKISDIKFIPDKNYVNAVVTFKNGNDAVKASKFKIVGGRRVRIGSFIENHSEEKKDHFNSLFFDFSTVKNCNKKVNIDLSDKNLGTNIALLETNLIEKTKEFLKNNLTENNSKKLILRNSDIIGCIDMIKGDFKVNIAPSNCLAILDFKNQKDAVFNQKMLNLKRFRNSVIYCEFAPESDKIENVYKNVEGINSTANIESIKNNISSINNNKLIVKNVPFQATESEIKKLFQAFSHVSDVRIPKKPDGSHRGFCFVVLDSKENLDLAIEYFGVSTHLYGRKLILEKAKS